MKLDSFKISKIIYFLFYTLINTNAILGLTSIFFFISLLDLAISGKFSEVGEEFSRIGFINIIPIFLLIFSYILITKLKDSTIFFIATLVILFISYFNVSQSTSINFADIKTQLAGLVYFIFLAVVLTILWKDIFFNDLKRVPYFLLIPIIIVPLLAQMADNFMFRQYISFANFINQRQFGYLFNSFQLDYIAFIILSLNLFGCLFALLWISLRKVLR